ncbi:MAG: comFC [Dehalococcoidia bacterium]|nr:comFC [Dehalococcoidia bacterium]
MNLLKGVPRLASASLDLLFPPRCVGCDKDGQLLCSPCRASLSHLPPPYCLRCAQPISYGDTCQRCMASPLAIDGIRAPFLMEGAIREAVHRLKYYNLRTLAPLLGALLADSLISQAVPVTALVPVPLHRRRERQRGYNQACLLAREAGKSLGLPVIPHALSRIKDTSPQVKSPGAEERRANVRDAFRCLHPSLVEGMAVAVVDDVCTTGATLESCAMALKEAGAASVWGVTLAREPLSRSHGLLRGEPPSGV